MTPDSFFQSPKRVISFDLDGVLFTAHHESNRDVEGAIPYVSNQGAILPVRPGTTEMMSSLLAPGWEVAFYTASFRSRSSLLEWSTRQGWPVSLVINRQLHEQKCADLGLSPAMVDRKIPCWFGIDLHVDDSMEIVAQIRRAGGHAHWVDPADPEWTTGVLAAAAGLR